MGSLRRVAVLGANSFSGQDFVDLLLDDPDRQVMGISRSAERSATFLRYRNRPRADVDRYQYHPLDLNRHGETVLALLDSFQPQAIVNFAAQSEVAPSWEAPEQWFQTNVVALACLIKELRHRDYLERFVQISSPEVYGSCVGTVTEAAPLNPSTPYAASKAAGDLLLQTFIRQHGFPALTVRATNVYGAGQQLYKVIPKSILAIRERELIPLHGGGHAIKSYIHIRDVSRGELAILEHGVPGEIYHLSPDEGIAVWKVVEKICDAMGVHFESVTASVAERPGQDAAYVIDSSKARQELRWCPEVGLEDGLAEAIQWIDREWDTIRRLPREYLHRA